MAHRHRQRTRERRRAFRRALVRGLALSAVLHAALAALWRAEPPPAPGTAAAADAAPSPAPVPEEALRAVEVRVRAGEEERAGRPVAARLPEADRPRVREPVSGGLALERVPAPGAPRVSLAAGAATSGGGASGREGEPAEISPPVPRSLLPQWSPPEEVRGTRVTVHVEVGPDGRPTGEVRLEPATESEGFNRRLRESLTALRYRPALRAGEPVTAWAEITFVF